MRRSVLLSLVGCFGLAAGVQAQDPRPGESITVGIEYNPAARPGLVVVPGVGIDSVRAIVRRDLDYSDRFELIAVSDPGAGGSSTGPINYGLYKALGAEFAVEMADRAGKVIARLHDVNGSQIRYEVEATLPAPTDGGFRMAVHTLSDELVRRALGEPGIAATRLLLVLNGRVHQVDSDGFGLRPLTPEGQTSLSPMWAPDGRRFAYTRLGAGRGGIYVQTLATGETTQVPGTETALNITPAWSPDGRTIAYAHSDERGTDIFTSVLGGGTQRLTVGRFADNLSPTYSNDGRRIAFISTRAGPPQLYAMGADGTDQELLAPFDYGVTGSSNAPEWSPDGAMVAFHREVQGTAQVHVLTVSGRKLRALTSAGRNEDPTWAPDGRHIAFVSDRSGQRQLWIIDSETGRVRHVPTPGRARLPSWSRRLAGAVTVPNP